MLTKTQVLAIFLGTASADIATLKTLFNGYSDAATQHDATNKKVIDGKTPAISGITCASNADCAEAKTNKKGETCGAVQFDGGAAAINMCVTKYQFCNSLGMENSVKFFVKCWADSTGTATAPAAEKVGEIYGQLQKFLDKKDEWKTYKNFWVSPETNYTDGWYFQRSDNKYEEKDWSSNTCVWNSQCNQTGGVKDAKPWKSCCAKYPDNNNKRCMLKTEAAKEVVLGPVKFTPACLPEETTATTTTKTGTTTVVPQNAGDDIAAGKIAKAAEQLKSWEATLKSDAQTKAKYSTMTAEQKTKWDADFKVQADRRAAEVKELKKLANYDDATKCNADCKAAFDEDLVKWRKDTYTKCKDNEVQPSCKLAFELRKKEDTARAVGDAKVNFYQMTTTQQASFNKNRAETIKAEETQLAAAWVKANKPKAGAEGGACDAKTKCASKTHCCGTMTPVKGAWVKEPTKNVCGDQSTKKWKDGLGEDFTHACNAKLASRIVASAAAGLAVAYSLI